MNEFTSRETWISYWKNKEIRKIDSFPFFNLIPERLLQKSGAKLVEVGGFPGLLLASLASSLRNPSLTILDYFILPEKVREVEQVCDLEHKSIREVQLDILGNEKHFEEKFDFVCSFGLIEHFNDTELILNKHIELCEDGGCVLLTFPNFRGINGFFQRIFDKENLEIHNLKMMDKSLISEILVKQKTIKNFEVGMFGKPMVWLEPEKMKNFFTRGLIKFSNKLLKQLRVNDSLFFTPYFYIKIFK